MTVNKANHILKRTDRQGQSPSCEWRRRSEDLLCQESPTAHHLHQRLVVLSDKTQEVGPQHIEQHLQQVASFGQFVVIECLDLVDVCLL